MQVSAITVAQPARIASRAAFRDFLHHVAVLTIMYLGPNSLSWAVEYITLIDQIYLRSDSSKYKLSLIRQSSPKTVPKARTTAHRGRYIGDPIEDEINQSDS